MGSEFVEMFAGVAAARVNSLYHAARKKAPCIIFIDEIDAIGRSRSTLGGDPGSQERESALLSMLVQMDGIHGNLEQVGWAGGVGAKSRPLRSWAVGWGGAEVDGWGAECIGQMCWTASGARRCT